VLSLTPGIGRRSFGVPKSGTPNAGWDQILRISFPKNIGRAAAARSLIASVGLEKAVGSNVCSFERRTRQTDESFDSPDVPSLTLEEAVTTESQPPGVY
jgi:hypothetical protein